jgi:hypothetical protein
MGGVVVVCLVTFANFDGETEENREKPLRSESDILWVQVKTAFARAASLPGCYAWMRLCSHVLCVCVFYIYIYIYIKHICHGYFLLCCNSSGVSPLSLTAHLQRDYCARGHVDAVRQLTDFLASLSVRHLQLVPQADTATWRVIESLRTPLDAEQCLHTAVNWLLLALREGAVPLLLLRSVISSAYILWKHKRLYNPLTN